MSAFEVAADCLADNDDPEFSMWWHPHRDVIDSRASLHLGGLGHIEHYAVSSLISPMRGYSPEHQLAIPTFGAMIWTVGNGSSFVDSNTALFVRGSEEFCETHPLSGMGHAALIITPSESFLDELTGGHLGVQARLFSSDTRPATVRAQFLGHRLATIGKDMSSLEIEELAVALIQELISARSVADINATRRVIDKAKVILHSLECEPLSLSQVASQIGVSPIYLTQAFKKLEGVPLYRYQSQLRLNRALEALPRSNSLTELALDLGYSSHSHFASAFRANFGITPSDYRRASRAKQ